MKIHYRSLLLALAVTFAGCASTTTSFEDYGRNVADGKVPEYLMSAPAVSDGLAINYANSVEHAMRLKFNGNRITREVSSTIQVALAAFGGAGAALNYSSSTVAALGLSSAGIPELQRIFNAKGRAEVYKDAAQLIRRSILEYRSHQPDPPSDKLTPNGIILVQRVSSAIDMVDDVLAGQMPSSIEMRDLLEPMTPAGTIKHDSNKPPVNTISTNPSAGAAEAALKVRMEDALAVNRTGTDQLSAQEVTDMFDRRIKEKENRDAAKALGLPGGIEFNQMATAVDANIPETQKASIYSGIFEKNKINLASPEFQDLPTGNNRQTFVEAYKLFPAKQPALNDALKDLKAKFPPR